MNEGKIRTYWSNFFGIPEYELSTHGVSLVAHKALQGYAGAWIFRRNQRIIFSVRNSDLEVVKNKLSLYPPKNTTVFSDAYVNRIFGPKIEKIIGPTFQGFYDAPILKPTNSKYVRKINYQDYEKQIVELSQSGDVTGWRHGGLNPKSDCIFAVLKENKVISVANYKLMDGEVGFIGIYTHPNYRNQGFGQKTVNQIVYHLMKKGKLALYQTLQSNIASSAVANRIGIKQFASNIAIRLKVN